MGKRRQRIRQQTHEVRRIRADHEQGHHDVYNHQLEQNLYRSFGPRRVSTRGDARYNHAISD